MKHEITTELRNSVIQVLANAVIKATWVEVNELLKKLQTLPIISEPKPEEKKEMTTPGSPAAVPEKKK